MNILICGDVDIPPPYGGLARRILTNTSNWEIENNISVLVYHRKANIDRLGLKKSRIYNVYDSTDKDSSFINNAKVVLAVIYSSFVFSITHPIISIKIFLKEMGLFARGSFSLIKLLTSLHYARVAYNILVTDRINAIEAHYGFESTLIVEYVAESLQIPVVISSYAEAIFWRDAKGNNISYRYDSLFDNTFKRAIKIITPSKHCSKGPLRFVKEEKIDIIYSSIDTSQFNGLINMKNKLKQEMGYTSDRIVLFVGQLDNRKGAHYLARCASTIVGKVPEARIVFIGNDMGAKNDLEEIIKDIKNRVTFKGGVPDDELRKFYVIADVLVFPSLSDQECMGLSMKEAMAAGTPVVAFNVGGVAEAVEDGATGYLVEPKNEGMLTEKIIKVLTNNEKDIMQDNCIRKSRELFDVKEAAKKEIDILRNSAGA
ncbi:MAG: glycosyltransferase family 4 protein [Candidatus Methanoperedens sp.]|nr:glycosyltransferase family 4 protein [Candidatus Methanoperedens sp.]